MNKNMGEKIKKTKTKTNSKNKKRTLTHTHVQYSKFPNETLRWPGVIILKTLRIEQLNK